MSCDWTSERLTAAVHGELDAAESARLQTHCAACPACAAELSAVRVIADHLGLPAESALVEPPPTLLRRCQAPARRRPLMAVTLAAACALIYLLAVRPANVVLTLATEPHTGEQQARALHASRLAGELELDVAGDAVAPFVEQRTGQRLSLSDDTAVTGAAAIPGGAVVALEIDGEPVTLLVTERGPDAVVEGWLDKQIEFREADGIKSLSWSRAGDAYVLVSALPDYGQRGCRGCHQSLDMRRSFDVLHSES